MNEAQKKSLLPYLADAEEKLAGVKDREKQEAELAADEERKPFPVVPFTEVDPAVLKVALDAIADVPGDLSETVGTLRKVCRKQTVPFAMRSDQLLAILAAAGVKE